MTSEPTSNLAKGLPARVFGVLTSPRATYADVVARPRALGVMVVVLMISISALVTFLSTEVGRQAVLDQQLRAIESFGITVNDATYERLQQAGSRAPVIGALGQAFSLLIGALAVSGIALAVVHAVLGARVTFKQVFAVVAHSGVVLTLQSLFVLPLDYVRETLASPTTLAAFMPVLDESSFVARLLGSIDLFVIWWLISLAIGLGVLSQHRTAPIATAMLVAYGGIGLTIAAVRSALAGA
ncbi:MAG: hypothetical protein A3G76_09710 [Acidobacteria bacterium RIFCSPLOWO2_12_FULL_65_11]|nr:MAG: hypothetical protein A3H95_08165 [Acidobacteria bacterium RIFCSPLOWO2_02_FULL_64_15]OFW34447.1 MAG: hypothetical protein A3G76_09710 [Acidobacteria bacterium RIFCSPLOWO2_12_FULL_65_11]